MSPSGTWRSPLLPVLRRPQHGFAAVWCFSVCAVFGVLSFIVWAQHCQAVSTGGPSPSYTNYQGRAGWPLDSANSVRHLRTRISQLSSASGAEKHRERMRRSSLYSFAQRRLGRVLAANMRREALGSRNPSGLHLQPPVAAGAAARPPGLPTPGTENVVPPGDRGLQSMAESKLKEEVEKKSAYRRLLDSVKDSIKVESFKPNLSNPMCPYIESTWSKCAGGSSLGVGTKFRVSVRNVGGSCETSVNQMTCSPFGDRTGTKNVGQEQPASAANLYGSDLKINLHPQQRTPSSPPRLPERKPDMSAWAPVKAPTARSETPQQPSGSEAALTAKAEKLLALHISKHIQARGKAFERVAPSIKIGRVWPDPLNPDCPHVDSTWSHCTGSCSQGDAFRVVVKRAPDSQCKSSLFRSDCVQVSDCKDPLRKWSLLQVKHPADLPGSVFRDLANKIPHESEWGQASADFPASSFQTTWSIRHFEGKALEDEECGLAMRSRFTLKEVSRVGGRYLSNTFEHGPASKLCLQEPVRSFTSAATLSGRPTVHAEHVAPPPPAAIKLSPAQQRDFDRFKEQIATGAVRVPAVLLRQLKPARYVPSTAHPDCPEIDSTHSDCDARCSRGTAYMLSVRFERGRCVAKAVELPCKDFSRCSSPSLRWELLSKKGTPELPPGQAEELANMIPGTVPLRPDPQDSHNLCSVFNTALSRRYRTSGDGPMGDSDCGNGYRNYLASGIDMRRGECFFVLIAVDDSSLCQADSQRFNTVMLSRHNELRQQYGIPPLKHDSSLQQFAEYWAHQLKKTHQCNLEHSTSTMHSAFTNAFSDLGENLWVGCVRGDPVWENAANDWFTEVYCYRYGKIGNRCTADKFENCDNSTHREGVMVGHFTQVMSDRSTHMGCASLLCDSLCQDKGPPRKKFLVVCNYGPGGNIIGVHPFKLEHAQRLNSLLKGTHVLPPAPEDPGSTKQCEARHRQFKVEKPKKNNL